MVGTVLALVFRGIFIALGAAAIERFSWIFFLFGAFLIYTAVKLYLDYRSDDDDDEATENAVMRWARRSFPSTPEFHGTKLTVVRGGKRLITPMFFVVVALGTTDLLFALDRSRPSTDSPRSRTWCSPPCSRHGAVATVFPDRWPAATLVYLSVGLSVILAFIGVKLVLHAMHEYHLDERGNGEIPIWLSLIVILGTDHHHRGQPARLQRRLSVEVAAGRPRRTRAAGSVRSATPKPGVAAADSQCRSPSPSSVTSESPSMCSAGNSWSEAGSAPIAAARPLRQDRRCRAEPAIRSGGGRTPRAAAPVAAPSGHVRPAEASRRPVVDPFDGGVEGSCARPRSICCSSIVGGRRRVQGSEPLGAARRLRLGCGGHGVRHSRQVVGTPCQMGGDVRSRPARDRAGLVPVGVGDADRVAEQSLGGLDRPVMNVGHGNRSDPLDHGTNLRPRGRPGPAPSAGKAVGATIYHDRRD